MNLKSLLEAPSHIMVNKVGTTLGQTLKFVFGGGVGDRQSDEASRWDLKHVCSFPPFGAL